MNIKQPPAYDISHWEDIPDFSQLNPQPMLVITKATEATAFVDSHFIEYMDGIKSAGIRRGCYHFHRKSYSPTDQAAHFVQWCKVAGVDKKDILVLDVEEGGESASQLQAWFVAVKAEFPSNLFMIYSRKNLLDPISMTSAQRDYFKNIPVWVAGYPLDPDDYSSPPDHYIPDQTKWGPVWMWQYSDRGIVGGVGGAVDLNWMSNEIQNWLGQATDPPPTGVEMHIYKIPQADIVRAFVTGYSTRKTVAEVASAFHATCEPGNHSIVINGDGWYGSQSNSIWWSNGVAKNTSQLDWRPRVVFDANHRMTMRFRGKPYYWPDNLSDYNTFSLTRRLVIGGAINPAYDETGELDARCGFGITAAKEFVIVGGDGWDIHHQGFPAQGVTTTQIGQELINQGVVEGGDGDGGGSFTLAYDGVVINSWYNDGNSMRPVINHLCLEIKGEVAPPPPAGVKPVKTVIELDDGSVWEATQFNQIS